MKTAVISLLFAVLLHPVHVSVTGIEYDAGKSVFNIFVKVYSDDMTRDMVIGDDQSGNAFIPDTDGFRKWLSERISLLSDGKHLEMRLISVEKDGVEHKFFLEAKAKRKTQTVTVSNTINTRLYPDQANMIMFKYKDIEEGFKLTVTDTLKVFNVN